MHTILPKWTTPHSAVPSQLFLVVAMISVCYFLIVGFAVLVHLLGCVCLVSTLLLVTLPFTGSYLQLILGDTASACPPRVAFLFLRGLSGTGTVVGMSTTITLLVGTGTTVAFILSYFPIEIHTTVVW